MTNLVSSAGSLLTDAFFPHLCTMYIDEGFITPVKDQGQCGSCWAFSAAGTIEAHVAIHGGNYQDLSPQNLLDCVGRRGSVPNSCRGGFMVDAYNYVIRNRGIATYALYPYYAQPGWCRYHPYYRGAGIQGYRAIESGEHAIKAVIGAIGPVSCIVVRGELLQHYKSGIFSRTDCQLVPGSYSHAVVIVSYGRESGMDYWLVKNSWGTWWGMDGYFKIARNVNMCDIARYIHYPVGAR